MKKGELNFIAKQTHWVSKQFAYSVSGFQHYIKRKNLPPYLEVKKGGNEWSAFIHIHNLLEKFDFIIAFNKMLATKVGDCCEQSLMLGMIFKNNLWFNEKYMVFQSSTCYSSERHTFLLLLPRNADLTNVKINLDKKAQYVYGERLLEYGNHIIIADPWQNKTFANDLTADNNPMSYSETTEFSQVIFYLQNLDLVYLQLQAEFTDYYIEIIKHQLLADVGKYASLKQAIDDNDYNLALTRSCISSECLEVTNLLLDNYDYLQIDLNARSEKLETVLDIARKYGNDSAIAKISNFSEDRGIEFEEISDPDFNQVQFGP